MHRWPNLITHGTPLPALRACKNSANINFAKNFMHNGDARLVPKDLYRWKEMVNFLSLVFLFTKNYPICNIDLWRMVRPLATHWITVNCKQIIIADFAPVRSVSVPFLTEWCWNSVCLLCWSDDHGTLFELHGKTNGKFAQHPWWHQGLLVEHLKYNKAVNHWLRKVSMWVKGGEVGVYQVKSLPKC